MIPSPVYVYYNIRPAKVKTLLCHKITQQSHERSQRSHERSTAETRKSRNQILRNKHRNKHKVTVDTSLRLGKYFGVSDRYFIDIQNDIDIRNQKIDMKDELDKIEPCIA